MPTFIVRVRATYQETLEHDVVVHDAASEWEARRAAQENFPTHRFNHLADGDRTIHKHHLVTHDVVAARKE